MKKGYSLVGVDGNAFNIMAYVLKAMKDTNFTKQEISDYTKKAMSEDYVHLLNLSVEIIDECNERLGLEEPEVEYENHEDAEWFWEN